MALLIKSRINAIIDGSIFDGHLAFVPIQFASLDIALFGFGHRAFSCSPGINEIATADPQSRTEPAEAGRNRKD
jgi:hypothetical protein